MLFPIKSQPIDWKPVILSENVLQRYLAENSSVIQKSYHEEPMRKNLCVGVPFQLNCWDKL